MGMATGPVEKAAAAGSVKRAGVRFGVHHRDAGHAAGGQQAVPVRHLRGPAVPHRVPDAAHRQPRPARHDLPRSAVVLLAGLVLDRRPCRCADRDAGLGALQALGHHLDHRGGRGRAGAVVADGPLRVRADRHHRDRGSDVGLRLSRALLRDDHRVAAAGAGADVVGSARRRAFRRLGRGGRRRASSSDLRPPGTHCCWPTAPSRWGSWPWR